MVMIPPVFPFSPPAQAEDSQVKKFMDEAVAKIGVPRFVGTEKYPSPALEYSDICVAL